jgi:hypothetical protein
LREPDFYQRYTHHVDIDNRGDFFPRGILAELIFRKLENEHSCPL